MQWGDKFQGFTALAEAEARAPPVAWRLVREFGRQRDSWTVGTGARDMSLHVLTVLEECASQSLQ